MSISMYPSPLCTQDQQIAVKIRIICIIIYRDVTLIKCGIMLEQGGKMDSHSHSVHSVNHTIVTRNIK